MKANRRLPSADTTVIFAYLTVKEYRHFMKADISYTGATGVGYAEGYKYGTSIATYAWNLPRALLALRWSHTLVSIIEHKVIIQKG